MYWTCIGHVLDMYWTCLDMFYTCCGHVLDMFWTCLVHGHVLDMFWICFGHVLDMFWTCFGYVLDMFWICLDMFWICLDMFWICFGHVLDMFRICFGHHGCQVPVPQKLFFELFRKYRTALGSDPCAWFTPEPRFRFVPQVPSQCTCPVQARIARFNISQLSPVRLVRPVARFASARFEPGCYPVASATCQSSSIRRTWGM